MAPWVGYAPTLRVLEAPVLLLHHQGIVLIHHKQDLNNLYQILW